MKLFAFSYTMVNEPDKIGQQVKSHIEYWGNKHFDYYKGGPFADKSGGLITFTASNEEEAKAIIAKDPFVIHNLLDKHIIKEWIAH